MQQSISFSSGGHLTFLLLFGYRKRWILKSLSGGHFHSGLACMIMYLLVQLLPYAVAAAALEVGNLYSNYIAQLKKRAQRQLKICLDNGFVHSVNGR